MAGPVPPDRSAAPPELSGPEAAPEEPRGVPSRRLEERAAELCAANAELVRAVRLKDEFLANTSHELRTPLNAILGMSEVLREQIHGMLNEKQLRCVRQIEDSGRQLLALINDILDLTRIETGKLELDVQPVPVPDICSSALQLIRQIAFKRQLRLTSRIDPLVRVINADLRRLKQILVNLLMNAVKLTPEGGSVGLEVSGDRAARRAHFTVWDTGAGVPSKEQADLFKPFADIPGSPERRPEGTGLGLALVQRIVDLHQGALSIESEPGRGSRFTVVLPWHEDVPLAAPDPAQAAPAAAEEVLAAPGRDPAQASLILLVEDNEQSLETFSDYLRAVGFRLSIARHGDEAVERASADRPDLILMDIHLPGMNGLEAMRVIRKNPALAAVPIIALTALVMPGDRERCLAAGASVYLPTPVRLRVLLKEIRGMLNTPSRS